VKPSSTRRSSRKLRNEFGIDLSRLALELPEEDSGVDVEAVFHAVTEAVLRQKRFEVVRLAMVAPFEYRKQVMAKDLKEIAASATGAPNEFLAKLAPNLSSKWAPDHYGGGTFTKLDALDEHGPPGPPAARGRQRFKSVVRRPCGAHREVLRPARPSGHRQVADDHQHDREPTRGRRARPVRRRKTRGASVVAHRLGRAELGTACLELHSEKADPAHVTRSLVEALDEVRPEDAGRFASSAREVAEKRQRLNQFVRRLHAPTPLGKTYSSRPLGGTRFGTSRPAVTHPDPLATSAELFENRLKALVALEASIEDCGGWQSHAFRASRLAVWTEKLESQASERLASLEAAAEGLMRAADAVALGSRRPDGPRRSRTGSCDGVAAPRGGSTAPLGARPRGARGSRRLSLRTSTARHGQRSPHGEARHPRGAMERPASTTSTSPRSMRS
jgi:hypothetical protein